MATRVLITAGPTREHLDPVRFLSNRSTGRMGIELAKEAKLRGFLPTIVAGPIEHEAPAGAEIVSVVSAREMFEEVKSRFKDSEIFIAAAAVSDFRPARTSESKIKKTGQGFTLELEANPDILAWCGEHKSPNQTVVGYALETDPSPDEAIRKMKAKHCDLMVNNSPENFGDGGGVQRLLSPERMLWAGQLSKAEMAEMLFDAIAEIRARG